MARNKAEHAALTPKVIALGIPEAPSYGPRDGIPQ